MRYAGAAGESVNEIRLSPRDNGRQRVEWAHVRVEPAAELFGHTRRLRQRGAAGSSSWGRTSTLVVESEAIVTTMPAERPPAGAGGEMAELDEPAYADRHAEFLGASAHVRWGGPVGELGDGLALEEGEGALAWVARPRGRGEPGHRLHDRARPGWTRRSRRSSGPARASARTWPT